MDEQLKLLLEALKKYNTYLQAMIETGKETVALLEAHIGHLETEETVDQVVGVGDEQNHED